MSSYGTNCARLVALEPDIQPNEFVLTTDTCTIGRSPLCQIIIRRAIVSRLHARIEVRDHGCVISDTSSTNGTFLNGRRIIQSQILRDYDLIGIGEAGAVLQFRTASSSTAISLYPSSDVPAEC